MSTASSGPYVLVRSRSSRDGVGARLDGWIPRTPSRGYGGGTSGKGCRPYLCQVNRTTAGVSTLPVSGRSYDRWHSPYMHPTSFPRRVGHVGGPVVRGCKDVATRSTFVISFSPLLGKTFSRCLIRVLKIRSCA
ncbi:hypothetical protein GW17_00061781 [Ensete ventricosum]|nr:hypothetical protein GW17_00061781 [Ensete ventricosum]